MFQVHQIDNIILKEPFIITENIELTIDERFKFTEILYYNGMLIISTQEGSSLQLLIIQLQ